MAVLIAEVFVIVSCAFQCTSLMWVAALCDPFVVVDRRPEVEGEWPWLLFRTSISHSRISEKEFG